jgi:hypothetical protein
MRSNGLKHGIIATFLALVILTATSARGLCLNQRTSPNCCAGKCQGMDMPPGSEGSNNCCAVSHGDYSQPAAVSAIRGASDDAHATASRIELSFLLRLLSNQPFLPGLEYWRHKIKYIRDLPTLTCALLM